VSIEKLWLGLAAIASLSIPPKLSVSIKDRTTCSSDHDIGTRDGN